MLSSAGTGLPELFLAAIQASLSVLLTIFYGGLAAWLELLDSKSTKAISKICVRMFLPALLVTKIGSELRSDSADRYLIIFIWAILCHFVSFVIGILAHLYLGMPDWTTVALMFNNTTSYPLLLISALDQTGILRNLIVSDESTQEAVERAKSYFLVFATVSSCLTFAVGPRLIDSEHAAEPTKEEHEEQHDSPPADAEEQANETTGLLDGNRPSNNATFFTSHNTFFPTNFRRQPDTSTSTSKASLHHRRASVVPHRQWIKFGPRSKWWLLFISDFFNAPLLGAILGAVIGLVPALHRAFFNETYDGGIFTAWLTSSLKTIGGLFVPLPVVVAGVSLYTSMRAARSVALPWITVGFVLVVRFVVWPIASIGVVHLLIERTELLGDDPMLWFAMMLMPTGPPAMKLITLVQVSDSGEEEEMKIAKLLTISYLISPILSLTVVESLRVSQAAIKL